MPIAIFERYMARQAMHSAGGRHQAYARLGQSEAGMVGGDDDVARERCFESATEREAVNGCDDRLVDIVARGDSGEAAFAAKRLAVRFGSSGARMR